MMLDNDLDEQLRCPWCIRLIFILLALAMAGAQCDGVEAPSSGPTPNLPQLTIAEPQKTPYSRSDWQPNGWEDLDGDGCDTRAEVLIEESDPKAHISRGCKVTGHWQDRYSGIEFSSPKDLDIDHIVSLGDANRSGGAAWSPEQKRQFANDTKNLVAVDASLNRAKGDQGPDEWLPPTDEGRCLLVSSYAATKHQYGLTVTPAQWQALKTQKEKCDG